MYLKMKSYEVIYLEPTGAQNDFIVTAVCLEKAVELAPRLAPTQIAEITAVTLFD